MIFFHNQDLRKMKLVLGWYIFRAYLKQYKYLISSKILYSIPDVSNAVTTGNPFSNTNAVTTGNPFKIWSFVGCFLQVVEMLMTGAVHSYLHSAIYFMKNVCMHGQQYN